MDKLKVDASNYALFNYTPYTNRKSEAIAKPKKLTYDIGDVVYIKEQNSIGVVLGCIDEDGQELRTDMDGMVSYDNIRPCKKEDFKIEGCFFTNQLHNEFFN